MARDPIMDKIHISCVGDSLVAAGERILLSMSAGKDSVAMFHLMREISDEMNLTIGVFHLNHGTRGEDSEADAIFVRDLCAGYGYMFHSCRDSFNPTEPSFEKRARERRYELLHEIAGKEKYDRIMTAHTKSDQAETVLMRLFTGTHISGLCAIPETRGKIVRPLLNCSSEEIVAYLKRNGFEWREDRSNEDTGYARNFIRHRVLPLIESRFPRSRDTIPDISDAAKENAALIEEMAEMCGMKFKNDNSSTQIDFGKINVSRLIFNW
ncbi:MAG TPA: tRNA lysidine(34) synthetase TilS, partial [Spirochaetota bacterium]|nr:tRNA lysidine(34) synthetase TilS [Spirochaetota bacterium]